MFFEPLLKIQYELGCRVGTLLQLRLMALSLPTCWSLLWGLTVGLARIWGACLLSHPRRSFCASISSARACKEKKKVVLTLDPPERLIWWYTAAHGSTTSFIILFRNWLKVWLRLLSGRNEVGKQWAIVLLWRKMHHSEQDMWEWGYFCASLPALNISFLWVNAGSNLWVQWSKQRTKGKCNTVGAGHKNNWAYPALEREQKSLHLCGWHWLEHFLSLAVPWVLWGFCQWQWRVRRWQRFLLAHTI